MIPNYPLEVDGLRAKDRLWIHPWDDVQALDTEKRPFITHGEGIHIFDSDGNRLIDGPGGMWCVNIGHGRDEMADAIWSQARTMSYCSPWGISNQPAAELAEKLIAYAPEGFGRVFFTTCGSTAVDSALRFALFYNNVLGRPSKKHIISRQDSYHGSTYLAASCSGKERDKNFMDFERGFVHLLPSPNPYRRPDEMSEEAFRDAKIQDLEDKILELGADNVAAFIAEPIQGSGGVIVPPEGYLKGCHEVCKRHDVLYISDEVVTAFGRLGAFFASEDVFGVNPDIITCAKGLTSGYQPLGAVLISDALIERIGAAGVKEATFSCGFTYSGHPVACAAALKNIEIIERENLLEHVREVSPYFLERLHDMYDIPIVGDTRGMGLMGCVECVISRAEKTPLLLDYEIGNRIDRHCHALGLLVRPLINMCVMSPPLTITRRQIDEMMGILHKGIELAMDDVRAEGICQF